MSAEERKKMDIAQVRVFEKVTQSSECHAFSVLLVSQMSIPYRLNYMIFAYICTTRAHIPMAIASAA